MRVFAIAALSLALAACATTSAPPERQCFHASEEIEKQYGYCQAIRYGDTLHVSGSVGAGPMPDAIAGAYRTLEYTLSAHGLTFEDVVKETVFVTDLDAFIANHELRKAYYGETFPASSWIQIDRLFLPEFVIEVEITAVFRINDLLVEISKCTICAAELPHGPRPVVQAHPDARILIAGQAPGRKVHESGIPFDDASGNRLRDWLGVDREVFYNPKLLAIAPMGFCFPGAGKSGDLPPRPECAPKWRKPLLALMPKVQLTVILGQYALKWHLDPAPKTVTDAVKRWEEYWPRILPLPHPSPRNQRWFKENAWFETEVLPKLRDRVRKLTLE